MNRRYWVALLVVSILVLIGVVVARNTYWVEIPVPTPPSGEAAKDDFYAAKQLVAQFGIRTAPVVSLGSLPRNGGVLLAPDLADDLLQDHFDALKAWVDGGGRLILSGSDIWSSARLQAWTGIAPASHFVQADKDRKPPEPCGPLELRVNGKPTGENLKACVRDPELAFASRRPVQWSLSNEYGLQMVRVAIGRGSVTVLPCECILKNHSILQYDHARILFASAALSRGDRLSFLDPEKAEPLLMLLWRLAAPALLAAAAALVLSLWRAWPRFGPLQPALAPVRRSLADQIRSNARFVWRTQKLASLRHTMRRAVHRSAVRRISAFSRFDVEQRLAALAGLTGFDRAELRTALEGTDVGDAESQRMAIDLLVRVTRVLDIGS